MTMAARSIATCAAAFSVAALLGGCGQSQPPATTTTPPPPPGAGFRSADCNGITDADVTKAVGSSMFTKSVVSDAGCFWQENTVLGTFGQGMGISTWWYRGSDMDTERTLEQQAGRTLTELSIDGNKGFKAHDANACSIYPVIFRKVLHASVVFGLPSTPARKWHCKRRQRFSYGKS